ncbi:ATP-binding protein [Marinobacterium arenosum]|uniref:ATP-binding protein n=1 Tax=Marinobacterium arenosum TaxID=2862496 RepID=UPI001C94CE44|nr:ATP-binding protein [Marinobacterium arenosum]MBY4676041.1 ATP-binding protein [Marinobacterium arenosum]
MTNTHSQPTFPFSAIVGQPHLKQALLLCAVDPKIGGVLISGPRGAAKSTLARALGDLLDQPDAAKSERTRPFVNLPLGCSEEKLTGSLDFDQALTEQRLQFSPGLLARADGGLLYVDEVNLLADGLVDLLLDASASGINHVERDGISHSHPARFVLIGTMNPDEGELRPQLLDRFGLFVDSGGPLSIEQRLEATERRIAFDDDPAGFCAVYQDQQQQLRDQLRRASVLLPEVAVDSDNRRLIAERCAEAGVDGLRADICLWRAARAAAALAGAVQVDESHIEAVSELVLAHRRQSTDQPVPPKPQQPPSADAAPDSSPDSGDSNPPPSNGSQQQSAGDWGALPAEPAAAPQQTGQRPQWQPQWQREARAAKKR